MAIPATQISRNAVAACMQIHQQFLAILGDDLLALWLHGGTTFPDRPRCGGDLDLCAIVAQAAAPERNPPNWRTDPSSRPYRLHGALDAAAVEHGLQMDCTFVLAAESRAPDPPSAFRQEYRQSPWPIYCAHWLAGQYMNLHGAEPQHFIRPPTAAELMRAMDRELEHMERHVFEGDASNPCEATYAIWNCCRILYTLDTGSPVISKRSAGLWALAHLPAVWHPAIESANRVYDGLGSPEDNQVIESAMAPFVDFVRRRLPPTETRPPGPPRWS